MGAYSLYRGLMVNAQMLTTGVMSPPDILIVVGMVVAIEHSTLQEILVILLEPKNHGEVMKPTVIGMDFTKL